MDEKEIVRIADLKYVVVSTVNGVKFYFGAISEDEEKVRICVLKNGELAGLKNGQTGKIIKTVLTKQVEYGTSEVITAKAYIKMEEKGIL